MACSGTLLAATGLRLLRRYTQGRAVRLTKYLHKRSHAICHHFVRL
jgi:hypothetical protein